MENKQTIEAPLMLGLKSIAEKLDVSIKTVMRMHEDGQIRLYRMRGKLFARYEELIEDLERMIEPRA